MEAAANAPDGDSLSASREAEQPAPGVIVRRLGPTAYDSTWRAMQAITSARNPSSADEIWLTEHEPIYTLGLAGRREHLLRDNAIPVLKVDRGGQITYHGPGQIVGYPIVDLKPDRCDVHKYVRDLEEVLIRTSGDYGISAGRVEGLTGVWVGREKLAAIGVRIARWVTSHGFALNVTTDLGYFDLIVPCGIAGRGVTSLARLLGREIDVRKVQDRLVAHFLEVFG